MVRDEDLCRPTGSDRPFKENYPFLYATDFLGLMGRITFGYFLLDVFLHFIFAVDIKGGPCLLPEERGQSIACLRIRSQAHLFCEASWKCGRKFLGFSRVENPLLSFYHQAVQATLP